MSGPRQLRATLAVLLLLVFALVPGLHGLSHALEHDAASTSCCEACGGSLAAHDVASERGAPANEHRHLEHEECGLCHLIHDRSDLALPGLAVVAVAVEPPGAARPRRPMRRCRDRSAWTAPARAPPCS